MAASSWQAENPYASFGMSVADSPADARVAFVRRTYTHLTVAIYAVAMLEWLILSSDYFTQVVMPTMMGGYNMLILFGAFLAVSYGAEYMAHSSTSRGVQYAALAAYVVAWAVFAAPMLYFAQEMSVKLPGGTSIGVIPAAAIATLVIFAGLTAIAWFSGTDFSFLGAGLGVAALAAFALIIASWIFGFNLGLFFSVAMIALTAGYILYDTSNVMHHYNPSQHVAASLALFASVALLFWYLLRLFMALSSRD